jgi:hypothetical protein
MMSEFEAFPKMPRMNREIIITEKIDGTNAQIHITEDGQFLVGSRNRYITPENDNAGFARWAYENKDELMKLGYGRHFGEWWGAGIQRRYGLSEKRFSLFNTTRWADPTVRPACCHIVPELYRGPLMNEQAMEDFNTYEPAWLAALVRLRTYGSFAAPGFTDPEGIIVYHTAAGIGFKITLEDDESPKSLVGKS